jgi:poly-gamma-glutamate capsule biosynthesis protein CapA/YwtB (metallophosphatase superfamily)
MKTHDLNIINLETTLTKSNKAVPKTFNFKADPDRVKCLRDAHIDIANLANNHILDFDVEGLRETIDELDEAGIRHTGAGVNIGEAKKPVTIIKDGIRIGVIGMTDNEPGWKAGTGKPGVNYVHVGDIMEAKQQVKNLRNSVDVLVISIHWGPNKREFPTREFIDFARELTENGVDIFHGHSAHVFQGLEFRGRSLIMYDTGDFIDDYAVDNSLRNDYSFLYQVDLDKTGINRLFLIPVLIKNMQVNKANGEDFHAIVKIFKKRCAIFKTEFKEHKDKLEIIAG